MNGARLSPFESILWRATQDPSRRLTVGVLILLDHPLEEKDLLAQVNAAVERAPRLRCRPDDPTFTHIRPTWAVEDHVDPEHHVRFVGVPAPGTLREVLDVVTLLEATPFDSDHSPWDLTVLQPVEDGRAALYARAHHVLTDGVGGVRLLQVLFDSDAPEADGKPVVRSVPSRSHEPPKDAGDDDAAGWSGKVTIDLGRAARSLSNGIGIARETQPLGTVVRGLQRALDLANSVSRQVMVMGGPLSPLPASHSVSSHFEVLSVGKAREAAIALGGSRNDLLVGAVATAVALYAERLGEPCSRVRIAMPARQRRDGALGGNWFAPTRVEVPAVTHHPARQFAIISERLAQARHEPALAITDTLVSAISLLPNRVLLPALQSQANAVDLAVTTIPGIRGRPRICGAEVQEAYPMGPRLGVPLNVTAFGSGDRLDIGITLDTAAITVPQGFLECLEEAFRRFSDSESAAVAVGVHH
ncbi:MAG TPA: wax ester/triacylglycerol synthase domain-containing protein [Acidimicrobiales bacterium]|nr:wax ester/triacylglycerol synthase domain-containing protein [Acidimicrobiales bacterium]